VRELAMARMMSRLEGRDFALTNADNRRMKRLIADTFYCKRHIAGTGIGDPDKPERCACIQCEIVLSNGACMKSNNKGALALTENENA